MIEFLIYSDVLLYRAKLEQIIYNYMKKKKYKYVINMNNLNFLNNNCLKIFVVDLESNNSINWIAKINKILGNNLLICLTYEPRKANVLLQRNLKYNKLISKTNINYEQHFISLFNQYFNGELYNIGKVIEYDNYKIPTNEIDYINSLNNHAIIKASTSLKEDYIYNININFDDIKNQLTDDFIILNDYFMVNRKKELNIKMNLKLSNNISKRKYPSYSQKIKNKILTLYYKEGMSVKELSEKYGPSCTTIYNWIKINEYEKIKKQMEIKVKKYDEISNIVNGGEET